MNDKQFNGGIPWSPGGYLAPGFFLLLLPIQEMTPAPAATIFYKRQSFYQSQNELSEIVSQNNPSFLLMLLHSGIWPLW